ncbi:MAG: HEPN domain-containing protein [Actinomycetota bacterium]|nr:HEPN domain-containing protein [Actinomycetota bacterium]
MLVNSHEYERWMDTARENLRVARHNAAGGFHPAAVLFAEQAAQCAFKALLHAAGAGERARGHGLLTLAGAVQELAGMALDEAQRTRLAALARTYQSSRYPDALPEGTPRDYYGADTAEAAIDTAASLLERVTAGYRALQAAGGEATRDDEHGGAGT